MKRPDRIEWIYDKIDGKSYSGGLRIFKDAPSYYSLYTLRETERKVRMIPSIMEICLAVVLNKVIPDLHAIGKEEDVG